MNDTRWAVEFVARLERLQRGSTSEHHLRLNPATHTEVRPHPLKSSADMKRFFRAERERLSGNESLPVAVQLEGSPINDAGHFMGCLERGTGQVDFERGSIRPIADQGIADREGSPVGGAAHRDAQTTVIGTAKVDNQTV